MTSQLHAITKNSGERTINIYVFLNRSLSGPRTVLNMGMVRTTPAWNQTQGAQSVSGSCHGSQYTSYSIVCIFLLPHVSGA